MGRPPCSDNIIRIKKGSWTPEEDIILVSYIQEHGPGNWKAVPTNTGLLRCSKSCRLRWTNYLRPGIKRGNFTPHEQGMIIHLQALLGNKWASIATYLPQRTDNDIKNYWNTHLKKKLKKTLHEKSTAADSSTDRSINTDNNMLLEGWTRSMSPSTPPPLASNNIVNEKGIFGKNVEVVDGASFAILSEGGSSLVDQEKDNFVNNIMDPPMLSFLEEWLLEESTSNNASMF